MTLLITAPVASPLLRLVTEVLGDFATAQRLFTAFDVTKECRTRCNTSGNKFYVNHATVRDMVSEFYMKELPPFQNGSDYIREDHAFFHNGRGVSAQIYRPIGTDLTDYLPDDIKVNLRNGSAFIPPANPLPNGQLGAIKLNKHGSASTVATPPPTAHIAPIAPTATLGKKPYGTVTRGSRGRITIPNEMVRALGLKHGDKVGIYTNVTDKSVTVTTRSLNIFYSAHHATIDKDCNIRIGKEAMEFFSLGKTSFNLTLDVALERIVIT